MKIDLNADLGEGAPSDGALLEVITSANIACGGHAGDGATMRATVREALARGVALGAHPSYPDREGFGRRVMAMPRRRLIEALTGQITALAAIVHELGASLQHVKAHGALYNAAVDDEGIASTVGEAVRGVDPRLIVVALAGSKMVVVFRSMGLRVAEEGFVDRGYTPRGTLVPRDRPDALITDPEAAAARAVRMVQQRTVISAGGGEVSIRADTLCVHADTPGSARLALATRAALEAAGVQVTRMAEIV